MVLRGFVVIFCHKDVQTANLVGWQKEVNRAGLRAFCINLLCLNGGLAEKG
jgi:hypothetical protein